MVWINITEMLKYYVNLNKCNHEIMATVHYHKIYPLLYQIYGLILNLDKSINALNIEYMYTEINVINIRRTVITFWSFISLSLSHNSNVFIKNKLLVIYDF